MEVIRLQNEIPEVYTMQSRDFQLLCRLYDCAINSTKFDVDTIKKISSTHDIRTNMLPLLQTKLGFFSNAKTTDEALRLILEAFPSLIKSKGSLKSINEAINLYLKILNVRVPVIITKTDDETQLYNITLPDHTVVIGLSTSFKNTAEIFKDLLKYIMPAGFNYYIYFYSSVADLSNFINSDNVAIIYISDSINSLIRAKGDTFNTDVEDRLIRSVSMMEVMGKEPVTSLQEVEIHKDVN